MTVPQASYLNWAFVVDLQPGFARSDMTPETGGNLYVPGGEKAVAKGAEIIASESNGVIVLSQDWHPADHISFMTNHSGVMAFREKHNPPKLSLMYFREDGSIQGVLAQDAEGNLIFKDGKPLIHNVTVDMNAPEGKDPFTYRGRITSVQDTAVPLSGEFADARIQALWPPHCVQGTESARIDTDVPLPQALREQLEDQTLNQRSFFYYQDEETGKYYVVIRKGMNSETDSYSLVQDNSLQAYTDAKPFMGLLAEAVAMNLRVIDPGFYGQVLLKESQPLIFPEALRYLPKLGEFLVALSRDVAGALDAAYEKLGSLAVAWKFMGIATDYCVRFSHRDTEAELMPLFGEYGIHVGMGVYRDAVAAVNVTPGDGEKALQTMAENGGQILTHSPAARRR